MHFSSYNPYTQQKLKDYQFSSEKEINDNLSKAHNSYFEWRKLSVKDRAYQLKQVGLLLLEYKDEAAQLITDEMGKPISQSISEIEKCATLCDYYYKNSDSFLATHSGPDSDSYIHYEPLGVILGIMPWNFPFWQVFRFVVPSLIAGNAVIIKHALNVPECALFIEDLFKKALLLPDVFQNMFLSNESTEQLISKPIIKGVSLTGSTRAGRAVGAAAGKAIKPVILELGGSNAMLVFNDADIDKAVKSCVQGRFANNGQSCIAVKRLLIDESIQGVFIKKLQSEISSFKVGNPNNVDTYISSLAKPEFAQILKSQIEDSVKLGAEVLVGGGYNGSCFEPTVVTRVSKDMPLFKQEAFGPVLSITTFKTDQEAIDLANATEFGLGVSLFSDNIEKMKSLIPFFDDGAVFINSFVKSRPSLPFGGTKTSGIGRELAEQGLKAFVNIKTVVIN